MIGQCTPYLSGNDYINNYNSNGNLWQIGSTQAIAYTVTSTSGTTTFTNNYVTLIAYVQSTTNMCSGTIAYIKTFVNTNTASCVASLDFNTPSYSTFTGTPINIYLSTTSYTPNSGATSTGVVVNT